MKKKGVRLVPFEPSRFIEEWRFWRLNRILAMAYIRRVRSLRLDLGVVCFPWITDGASKAWVLHASGVPWLISLHGTYPLVSLPEWVKSNVGYALTTAGGPVDIPEPGGHHLRTLDRNPNCLGWLCRHLFVHKPVGLRVVL